MVLLLRAFGFCRGGERAGPSGMPGKRGANTTKGGHHGSIEVEMDREREIQGGEKQLGCDVMFLSKV